MSELNWIPCTDYTELPVGNSLVYTDGRKGYQVTSVVINKVIYE